MIMLVGGSHLEKDSYNDFYGATHFIRYIHGLATIFDKIVVFAKIIPIRNNNLSLVDRNKITCISIEHQTPYGFFPSLLHTFDILRIW